MFHRRRRVIGFGCPPFLFTAVNLFAKRAVLLVAMTLASMTAAMAGATPQYRLAGTIAVGKDYLAFLELPVGGQVLVRNGSIVGNAKVVEVTEKSVRLLLPDRTLLLSLEGTGGAPPEVSSAAVRSSKDDDRNRVYTREVATDQFSREISQSTKSVGVQAGADARLVAAQRIAAVVDLPPGSRLLAVKGTPVTSADAAIRQIEKVLVNDRIVADLDILVDGKRGRVYLMPARD